MNEEQIRKRITELERDEMGYLEANDKRGATRKRNKIRELEDKLEVLKLKEIQEDLALYKKFIHKRGLNSEFQSFMIVELARDKN